MKGDKKQIIILISSLAVGLVAFMLTHVYLKGEMAKLEQRKRDFEASMEQITVLGATRPLPTGTVLQRSDLGTVDVARKMLSSEPVTEEDLDRIVGRRLKFPVEKYGPVLWAFVDTPYGPKSGLAPTIKKRMRAVSISAGGASAVSGLIKPKDRVDVIGTFSFPAKDGSGEMEIVTMTVLQNVTILATGSETAKGSLPEFGVRRSGSRGYSLVTLELTPEEVELLVFAEYMKGRLTLSLRNPEDVHYIRNNDLKSINFEDLQTRIPEYNESRQNRLLSRHR